MQATRKQKATQVNAEQFDLGNPFVSWYVSYWRHDAGTCRSKVSPDGSLSGDLVMGDMASMRFSVGVDDDKVPVLGIAQPDAGAVMSIPWTEAAFLRRVQRKDWVALSCPDARMEGGGYAVPVPLRLWLPTTMGRLDGWLGARPTPVTLRIVEATIRKGKPSPAGLPPLALLPLSFKGQWDDQGIPSPGGNATALVQG